MSTILVFDVDGPRRAALTAALERRFGADYEVVATAWSDATEAAVSGLLTDANGQDSGRWTNRTT